MPEYPGSFEHLVEDPTVVRLGKPILIDGEIWYYRCVTTGKHYCEEQDSLTAKGNAHIIQSGGQCTAHGTVQVEQTGGECIAQDNAQVIQSGGKCVAEDDAQVTQLDGYCVAYHYSRITQSGGDCHAIGNIQVILSGGNCRALNNTKVTQTGGKCLAGDNAHITLINGACAACGNAQVIQSGGVCVAFGNVQVYQSGGGCKTHGNAQIHKVARLPEARQIPKKEKPAQTRLVSMGTARVPAGKPVFNKEGWKLWEEEGSEEDILGDWDLEGLSADDESEAAEQFLLEKLSSSGPVEVSGLSFGEAIEDLVATDALMEEKRRNA